MYIKLDAGLDTYAKGYITQSESELYLELRNDFWYTFLDFNLIASF